MYCAEPVEERKFLRIEKIHHRLRKEKPTEKRLLKLTDEFNKNWETIREKNWETIREKQLSHLVVTLQHSDHSVHTPEDN